MKTARIAGFLAVLALWLGYSRGYRQGVQTERRAWESSVQRDTSMVALDNKYRQRPLLYKNPHVGLVFVPVQGKASVNVPDPRNMPVK